MNKTEMKNIVKNTDYNTVYCYHQDHAGFVPQELVENADGLVNIVFRPFDFATLAAVSREGGGSRRAGGRRISPGDPGSAGIVLCVESLCKCEAGKV